MTGTPFGIKAGIRRLFRLAPHDRERIACDVDDQIALHIDLRVEQLIARGMTPSDARAEAIRRFGALERAHPTLVSSAHRRELHMRLRDSLDSLRLDLVHALRALRKQPGFTLAVIVTLALGIGANAAMFGIVDRLLLRPPAHLRDPGETGRVFVFGTYRGEETPSSNFAWQRYLDLRGSTSSFAAMAGFFNTEMVVGVGETAHQTQVAAVTGDFWSFFGVRPALGRFFTPAEDVTPRGAEVAVLGNAYWQEKHAGDPGVIGQRLQIGGNVYTIVGVAPKGFTGTSLASISAFVPVSVAIGSMYRARPGRPPWYEGYNFQWMEIVARRKPGVSIAAANADLSTAYRRSLERERPGPTRGAQLDSLRPRAEIASIILDRGPEARASAKVATWLGGVSLLVLLVACANVASLLLARALGRRREIAVRIALGVSRTRLVRYLLTESILLAMAGGIVAVVVAAMASTGLRALVLPGVDWPNPMADGRMLLFTGCAALLAGLVTGLTPALQHAGSDLTNALKAGGREGGVRRTRLRSSLIALQGAISVILLVGAGLFVRSLHNVREVNLGFDAGRLLFVNLELRGTQLAPDQQEALREQVRQLAMTLPQVEAASVTVDVPFAQRWSQDVFAPDVDPARTREAPGANAVSPEYFVTTGTPVLRGRGFLDSDVRGGALVAVVSESLARGLWDGDDAIGKCIRFGVETAPCRTVVGVVADTRRSFDEGPRPHIYLPSAQEAGPGLGLFVRTRGSADASLETVRRALQRAMPGTAYVEAVSMRSFVDPEIRPWELGAAMFTLFGVLALVLAAVGLFSVISYNVSQRTHELGVRIALGAGSRNVLSLVVREGLRIVAIGTAIGVVVALATGRFLAPLLYEVSERDPWTFALVVTTLIAVAAGASFIPARRATRVDPTQALRGE